MEKLHWRVKNNTDFTQEVDFLDTILKSVGVENVQEFLHPTVKHTHDPLLLKNMEKGLELLHNNLDKKIFIKVDPDVDGYTSAAYVRLFLQKLNPNIQIEYKLDYNKRHGLYYEDIKDIKDLGLVIIPDASFEVEEGKKIQEKIGVPLLIIDHHIIEKENEDIHKYATVINCTDGVYPNPTLSGVGVVHKFFTAYCSKYNLPQSMCDYYLDLVALGMIADSMDLRNLETRYYALQGLSIEHRNNELIKEMAIAYAEDMKFGHTITNYGWVIAPKMNGTIRYGKETEQIDLFRALCEEKEDREYQPRRKVASDPKPPLEIHSLQKTMARVCKNVKQRQDTEVSRFMKKIEEEIISKNLTQNSIIVIDGTKILEKGTVTGLVANRIASKYTRPVLILRESSENRDCYGGSGRGSGKISDNFKDLLLETGLFEKCLGHPNAFGIELRKDRVEDVIKACNEKIKLEDLVVVYDVDYEIKAEKLKEKDIREVANSFEIWGNEVPEPTFAITGLRINSKDINAYGEKNNFIRFVYHKIPFIKKYCKATDYYDLILQKEDDFGKINRNLEINLICRFVLNEYEGEVFPQVRIEAFDSKEYVGTKDDDDFMF